MCGICGYAVAGNTDSRPPLARVNEALQHRGPDSQGIREDVRTGLAMCRLAVIDLQTGEQAMSEETGELWIAFNGEIYNQSELGPELEANGHSFRTRSDTEMCFRFRRGNDGSVPSEHWTQDPAQGGGRVVVEACHFTDLLRYLAGSKMS